MITKIEGKCQYEGCEAAATDIACGRSFGRRKGHGLGCYCFAHACMVAEEESPEYTNTCPNCGCMSGVN